MFKRFSLSALKRSPVIVAAVCIAVVLLFAWQTGERVMPGIMIGLILMIVAVTGSRFRE